MSVAARPRWPPWWGALNSWTRASSLGLAAAALLAIGLGWYIPRQVERHMLQSQAVTNRQVLEALLSARTLPGPDSGAGFDQLDRFVSDSIVRGDFVRVKVWDPRGRIAYSDDRRLVGRWFPPTTNLTTAFNGQVSTEISDLSEPENQLERGLARRLLEFYIPVERDGRVETVWEVYQSLDRFEAQLGKVRLAVWASVGSGLAILLVFLVSSFGGLVAAIQARRREAEERGRELGVLLDVSKAVNAPLGSQRLGEEAVRVIREAGDYRAVAIVDRGSSPAPGGEQMVASSFGSGCDAACVLRARVGVQTHPEGCTSFGVELGAERSDLRLVACTPAPYTYSDREQRLLRAAGEQIRTARENARLYQKVRIAQRDERQLMSRLVSAHEEERQRIVGEIHDGLGQDLHRVLFGVRGLHEATATEMRDELGRIEEIIHKSVQRLRALMQELRPPSLADVGLEASLRSLASRAQQEDGLEVEIRTERPPQPEPSTPVRVAAYRIAQEALRNVAKHAHAHHALLTLSHDDGAICLSVRDDGHGSAIPPEGGLGVWLMRERAQALGGTLDITSGSGGTTVLARLPNKEPQP